VGFKGSAEAPSFCKQEEAKKLLYSGTFGRRTSVATPLNQIQKNFFGSFL
jgi:hypothetical protein